MFSLIIPIYNEQQSIEKVISEYYSALKAQPYPFEIIAVDDYSTDQSAEVIKKFPVRFIQNKQNYGYGRSLKIGITNARFDNIIITDADCSYPSSLIGSLMESYLQGGNMTVASRTGEHFNSTLSEKTTRWLLRALIEILVSKTMIDVNSGYRIFNRKTIHSLTDRMSDGFSFTTSLTMIYALTGIPILYIPCKYGKRMGKTKVKFLKDSLKTVIRVIKLFFYFRIYKHKSASYIYPGIDKV